MFAINGLFLWAYDLDEDKLASARLAATGDVPAGS
jgi:GPH family glycoside/pentoside/hexuronide:cation symporter